MWLNDTSISQRLTLGFGIVFLLVMLLLGVHVYEQQRLNESIAQLTDQIMPRADAASNIETAYLRESADVRSYVLSGNERYLAAYNKAVASSQNALASLDKMLKTKEGRELFDQIQPLAAQYTEAAVKAIALRQQGKLAEAQQTIEQEMLPMREQLLEKADAFVALEFSLRNQAKSDVGKTQSDTNLLSIVVAFLVIVCATLVSFFTSQSVSRPTRRLFLACRALAGGDFGPALAIAPKVGSLQEVQTARDELLVLSATFSSMAQQLFNREKRLSARASLSSILASSIDAEQLASEALREIAKYANCEIGLVYIHNPKTNALRRVGTHSLDDAPQTIKVGDGILGEAAASRRTVLVRDIPTDAPFQVRFGFDQVPPKTIVAVPMVCQDQLVGAMLLGGLRDLSDDAVSFTETSVYQLGLSLQVALAHEQVQMLAANLQEKNEELQAQSEEIQAQNEEIQTQNEELQRQNEELQAQAEEIQAQSDELSKQNEEIEAQRKHLIERNDELARLRQTAEAEKQNLQIIIDSMPEGVVICDAEGRITITNKAADELYRRPVPYGAPVDEYAEDLQLYRPDGTLYPSLELPLARSALQSETLKGVEMIIKWPTGEQKPLLCNTAPLFDHEGALAGAVGVFQDISALKEIEHLKDEFLSVASHELKSPLTSLKGFAQILHERVRPTQLYEEFRVPLQIIDSQVDKVVWLVNRLLDVSRVQMGRLEMKPQRINLAELVSKQVDQARVKSEKHQWVLDVQDDVVGYWDPGYIEQVVTNLLDNAIRYSPNGGEIRVSMRRADGKAYLSVADQGIGIAPEALSNLFKRYYRSEGAKRISAEGMGIGLYVTHAIVDAHGGRIWVDSEPGKGSTFSVELPLSQFTIQSS